MISVSIVSHGQADLVAALLRDLERVAGESIAEVLLTLNVPESLESSGIGRLSLPLRVIENASPKGFGANHNAAFRKAKGKYFCVMNPDIRLRGNPFRSLLEVLDHRSAAVVAPAVLSPSGGLEDSIRRFPTFRSLVRKLFGAEGQDYDYSPGAMPFEVDWVAGMFLLFRSEAFQEVGGFDERYYLYYEDVDICARIRRAGSTVLACPQVQVIHDARRASRRDIRHMYWHASSMARYFAGYWMRLP